MSRSFEPFRSLAGAVLAAGFAIAISGASPAVGQELPTVSQPVLITSLGQSLDAFQVQLATKRAGVALAYDPLATLDMLDDAKTLFLVVGASLKGFGEAGISINDERGRARSFLEAAEARGIPVIVLHVGGSERRDDLTNQLIEVTAPQADALFIRSDGDLDGKFAGIADAGGIPLVAVEGIVQLVPELKRLFSGT